MHALQGLLKDSITFMSSSESSKSKTCIKKYIKMSQTQTTLELGTYSSRLCTVTDRTLRDICINYSLPQPISSQSGEESCITS